jgi:hypothetical protein
MMVLFFICLSWSVLLGPIMLSCFRLKHSGRQCWGYPKIRMESPNTRESTIDTFKYSNDARGDKESPKDCPSLKSCVPFYTCPRAPFYRETKGLLHSENTLELKEYS